MQGTLSTEDDRRKKLVAVGTCDHVVLIPADEVESYAHGFRAFGVLAVVLALLAAILCWIVS